MTAAGPAATPQASDPAAAPVIAASRLLLAHGRLPVVKDLTIAIPAGATVALLGANGSGKSTLLAVLAALRAPHGGELAIFGHPLPEDRWAVRGRVGLVAHHPLLYRELTIRENLHYHARLLALPASRAEELLEASELSARADQPVGALSRGLTQRAAVARAMLADPPLLLLDEPLANLDPVASEVVARLLAGGAPRRTSRFPGQDKEIGTFTEQPRTRVIASHDPERALAQASHAIVLGPRAQVRHAGPSEGLTVAAVEAMYR